MLIKLQQKQINAVHALLAVVTGRAIEGHFGDAVMKIIEDVKTMFILPTIDDAEKWLEELKEQISPSKQEEKKKDSE